MSRKKRLDTTRDQEIVDLYHQGESIRSISRATGLTAITITNALERHGVQQLPDEGRPMLGHRKDLPLTTAEIAERYKSGTTLGQLAELCGAAEQTVRQRLMDHGVFVHGRYNPQQGDEPPAPTKPGRSRRKEAPEQDIARAYEAGRTLVQLSEQFGLAPSTIRSILLRNAVPLRAPTKAPGAALSEEQQEEAVRLYVGGSSERHIADVLGVSRTTVQNLIEHRGIPRRRSLHSDLPIEELARRHASGETAAALAREYGVGPTTIKRRLKQYGAGKDQP